MMQSIMICLVGEQPVPNVLPIRHYRSQQVLLVHSDFTRRVTDNLQRFLQGECATLSCDVPAYEMVQAQHDLAQRLCQPDCQGANFIFNVTGGTKPMSLAAFRLAQELSAPVIYLQSEGSQSLLYCYEFNNARLVLRERLLIKESLTIGDYLKAHGFLNNVPRNTQPEAFEQVVLNTLQPHLSQIIVGQSLGPNLEIDLMLRCQNQFGIAEVKAGKKAERIDGIHQLNTASQRDYLGTYTKRFLIVDRPLGSNNRELARAHNIVVIELHSYCTSGALSGADSNHLVSEVTKILGNKS
jgi:hypothetical protein